MPDRLMVIFSLGGVAVSGHLGPRTVRCRTGLVPADGAPSIVLDKFPDRRASGIVEGGRARIERDGASVAARDLGDQPGRRWEDVDLLAFAATTLWTWIALPLALQRPELDVRTAGGGRVEVAVPAAWPATAGTHVLHLDGAGQVIRHEEPGGRLVHELSGHCAFGDAIVATRRRSRLRDRVPVLWADVVAAHLIPGAPAIPPQ